MLRPKIYVTILMVQVEIFVATHVGDGCGVEVAMVVPHRSDETNDLSREFGGVGRDFCCSRVCDDCSDVVSTVVPLTFYGAGRDFCRKTSCNGGGAEVATRDGCGAACHSFYFGYYFSRDNL